LFTFLTVLTLFTFSGEIIALKFSGRTDSRGARLLKRSYGRSLGSGSTPTAASGLALMLACACVVLWLLATALRHALGAPQSAGFISILLTPFIVAARWSAHISASAGWWLAVGVLLLGALWYFAAPFLKRRGGDAVFAALLTLEFFWLLRWYNSRLSVAGAPTWSDLSHAQQASLTLGVLVLLCLLGAVLLLPAARPSYENSAPSRVTSFIQKRRLPSRIAGAVLMALATGCVAFTAFQLEANVTQKIFFGLLSAPLLFGFWIVLDVVYFVGRKMWRRLT
jgi:hypothetical protein